MLTTVIGAFPKPDYLKLTDWFKTKGGTDTAYPTTLYDNEIKNLGPDTEKIFQDATKDVINDQIECGIDIITDGEIRRENYIHYHCRHMNGINFKKLNKKTARTGNYICYLPTIENKITASKEFLATEWSNNKKLSSKPIKTIVGLIAIYICY